MDWPKAKNILIFIFIILNIFLLVYKGVYGNSSAVTKEDVAIVLEILERNGVTVSDTCKIPLYNKNTSMLIFENNDVDRQKITEKLLNKNYTDIIEQNVQQNQNNIISVENKRLIFGEGLAFTYYNNINKIISNTNSGVEYYGTNSEDNDHLNEINAGSGIEDSIKVNKNVEKQLRKYFSDMGINMTHFVLDRHIENLDNSETYVFIEKYKDFLIYENKISIDVYENCITKIMVNIKRIKGFTKTPLPILPAHHVILKNFYNKKDIVIKSIDIGFKGFKSEESELNPKEISQGPAWRIIINDGEEIFFKAYDGEQIN